MYLLEDAIREVWTPIIIAHEMFHYHINDDGLLARGLEEAIADFLSVFHFSARYFGNRFAFNYYIEMRYARDATTQRFDLYTDDLIKLLIMIDEIGWDKIINACIKGRKSLKKLEYQFREYSRPKTDQNKSVSEAKTLLKNLVLTTPRNQVISPLGIVTMLSQKGAPFNIPIEIVTQSLEEIQRRVFGVLSDDGVIEFDDFENLTKEGVAIIDTKGIDS